MSLLVLVPTVPEGEPLVARLPAGAVLETCGLGLVAAALGAARAVTHHRPRFVVLAGLAGTRDPRRAPPGAVVAGTSVRNEGLGAGQAEGFLAWRQMGLPTGLTLPPDEYALARVPGATDSAIAGVVGTVAAASGTPAEAAARHRRDPEVLVEEMEGLAVAAACAQAGVPLAIVRAVSNVAGDRDHRTWVLRPALEALAAVLSRVRPPGEGAR